VVPSKRTHSIALLILPVQVELVPTAEQNELVLVIETSCGDLQGGCTHTHTHTQHTQLCKQEPHATTLLANHMEL